MVLEGGSFFVVCEALRQKEEEVLFSGTWYWAFGKEAVVISPPSTFWETCTENLVVGTWWNAISYSWVLGSNRRGTVEFFGAMILAANGHGS